MPAHILTPYMIGQSHMPEESFSLQHQHQQNHLPQPVRPINMREEQEVEVDCKDHQVKWHISMEILEELDIESRAVLKKLVTKLEKKLPVGKVVRDDKEVQSSQYSRHNVVPDWLEKFESVLQGESKEGDDGILTRGLGPSEENVVSKLGRFKMKTFQAGENVNEVNSRQK
ncbi:hypothetical protein Ancab_031697 [Ancistrocladus abbreviatus]